MTSKQYYTLLSILCAGIASVAKTDIIFICYISTSIIFLFLAIFTEKK